MPCSLLGHLIDAAGPGESSFGDLQAFSGPWPGYMPKVPTTVLLVLGLSALYVLIP